MRLEKPETLYDYADNPGDVPGPLFLKSFENDARVIAIGGEFSPEDFEERARRFASTYLTFRDAGLFSVLSKLVEEDQRGLFGLRRLGRANRAHKKGDRKQSKRRK